MVQFRPGLFKTNEEKKTNFFLVLLRFPKLVCYFKIVKIQCAEAPCAASKFLILNLESCLPTRHVLR